MKKILRILGILFWVVGVIGIVYIMGEVLSRAEGYTSLANLVGPLLFHVVSMFLGGFFFVKGTKKALDETEKSVPVTQA